MYFLIFGYDESDADISPTVLGAIQYAEFRFSHSPVCQYQRVITRWSCSSMSRTAITRTQVIQTGDGSIYIGYLCTYSWFTRLDLLHTYIFFMRRESLDYWSPSEWPTCQQQSTKMGLLDCHATCNGFSRPTTFIESATDLYVYPGSWCAPLLMKADHWLVTRYECDWLYSLLGTGIRL